MQSTLLRASRRRYKDEIKPIYLVLGCAAHRNALSNVKHLSLENPQQTQAFPKEPRYNPRQSSSSCLRLYPASISHNNRVLRHYSAASLGPLMGDRVLRIVNVALGIFSITSCRVDDPCYTTSRLHRGSSNIAKDVPYCRDWKTRPPLDHSKTSARVTRRESSETRAAIE